MAATADTMLNKEVVEEDGEVQSSEAEVPVSDNDEVQDNVASDEQSPKETESEEEKNDHKAYSHPIGDDHCLGLEVVSGDDNSGSASYDLVAIHGMHTWSRSPWSKMPKGPQFESWLDIRFPNLSEHSGRVMLYGHDPGDRSGKTFTPYGVYEEAEAMLNALLELRPSEIREKRRPIWFLSHDLGGLIVKAAMVLAARYESKYADILHCTRSLVFFGYPHRYETRGVLEEGISRLLTPMQYRPYPEHLLRITKSLSQIVIEVNDAFIQTPLLTQAILVNVVSTNPQNQVTIFEPSTAVMNIPFERRIDIEQPNHWLMAQTPDKPHAFCNEPNDEWLGVELPDNLYPSLRQFVNQASPIYPYIKNDMMTDFPELEGLVNPFDDRIIHLRCTHANASTTAWVSERARRYLQARKEASQPLLFFKFDAHDVRFNNASAMLQTFISRFIFLRPREIDDAPKNIATSLELAGVTAPIRLFSDFEYLGGALSDFENTVHVLGCFDECDDSAQWFLEQIRDYLGRSENTFRLVIVTTHGTKNDEALASALSRFPESIVTSVEYEPPKPQPLKVDQSTALLFQERPQFFWDDHYQQIRDLLAKYQHDEDLYHLLIDWFKSAREPFESGIRLFNEPFQPGLVFATALAEVPDARRPWAQKLLTWVLTSLRPLRVAEFYWISNYVLRGAEGSNHREPTHEHATFHHITNILKYFGGLLVVVYGEIRFSHPETRDWLLNQDNTEDNPVWYLQGSEPERNQVVLENCLSYLCDEGANAASWAQRLPYTIEFWPRHYRQTASADDVTKDLFEKEALFQRWIEAYVALPTPFLKPHPTSRKLLPVAAHFGFEDLVRSALAESQHDVETRSQALVEATRAGQLAVTELLVDSLASDLSFDDEYLHKAIKAASFCDDPEVFRKVVKLIPEPLHAIPVRNARSQADQPPNEPQSLETGVQEAETNGNQSDDKDPSDGKDTVDNKDADSQSQDKNRTSPDQAPEEAPGTDGPHDPFHWLAVPLLQASTSGLDDVITKLLSVGANPNPPKGTHLNEKTPLHRASAYGKISTIKLLVDAGASLVTPRTTPLLAAISPLAATTLLERGAAVDLKMLDEEQVPVQILSRWGDYLLLDIILQHRDYREYLKEAPEGNPVTQAARYRNRKCLEILLRYGFNPNIPNEDGETALWWTVNNERPDMCRLLLENGADPDLTPEGAVPPLIESVFVKSMDILKLLVEHKADIEKREIPGRGWERTPLLTAVDYGDADRVEYLLKRGADPNVKDSDDLWAIYTAAENGRADLVRMLAEAGAGLNSLSAPERWTPLHGAYKSPEVVELLLELGADVTILTLSLFTPLDLTIFHGQRATMDVILSKAKVKFDLSLEGTQKALRHAVDENYIDGIEGIMEAGANVDMLDPTNDNNKNESLLCMAMRLASEDMVRKLLEFRPDLTIRSEKQNTVLHCMTNLSPVASFRLVVNAGGRLDIVNNKGYTPLQMAALNVNVEVVRYMLTKEAARSMIDNSPQDQSGTALHNACDLGSLEIVELLIENGCDVNLVTDGLFGTPLIAATIGPKEDPSGLKKSIIELLLEKGADLSLRSGCYGYPLNSACMASSVDIIALLLEKGASPDVQDPFGRKPAHMACYHSLEVLNLLKVPDSDFAVRDGVGRVPLHYAVGSGEQDIVGEVLARSERVGVGIDVKDNDGWTPLLWAARAAPSFRQPYPSDPMSTDMVSFLLERGADPTIEGLGFPAPSPASQIAYYSGADAIGDLLTAKNGKEPPSTKRRGKRVTNGFCDCCLLEIVGSYVKCETCDDFGLCFKCSRVRSKFHPRHPFRDEGEEWDDNGNVEPEKPEAVAETPVEVVNGDIPVAVPEEGSQSDEFDDEIVG
ncbi:hypothetical protein ACHAPT_012005 [Fusarium lateritium]